GGGRRSGPLSPVGEPAAAFSRGALRGPDGARARDYLAQRGIRPDTIERFGLGYAPGGGDALARHLRAQALSLDDAVSAGLVMRRTAGGLLDRFRDRLIFPIADLRGRGGAFGGRVLPGPPPTGDPPPKYLNSPESPIFHKGRSLYGLTLARDAIRERGRVAVVEGYLDVIAVAQAGIGEVVAPLGTALTVDQLGIVSRFTERVIACFDGDAAGRRAAARSFPTFIDAGPARPRCPLPRPRRSRHVRPPARRRGLRRAARPCRAAHRSMARRRRRSRPRRREASRRSGPRGGPPAATAAQPRSRQVRRARG